MWDNLKDAIKEVIKTNGNQEITGQLLQDCLISIIDNLGGNIADTEISETIRKSINPSSYVSYLPEGTEYVSPSIPANIPTKIKIPTTIKSINDFAIVDRGGGNYAVKYIGTKQRTFKIFLSTGMKTGTNNVVIDMYMYRNDIMEPGIGITRKVGTGADVGALACVGEFAASPNDILEVYIKASLQTTITYLRTSIIFTEKN